MSINKQNCTVHFHYYQFKESNGQIKLAIESGMGVGGDVYCILHYKPTHKQNLVLLSSDALASSISQAGYFS